jgi:hypothetical protein
MPRPRERRPAVNGAPPEISRHQAADDDRQSTRLHRHDVHPSLFDDAPTVDDVLAGRDHAGRNADEWWLSTAMQAVRVMATTGREFQAFDLVQTYRVPEPDHPNRWGALFTRAAREGVIVPVGAAPSRRPTAARSLTRTWRGATR